MGKYIQRLELIDKGVAYQTSIKLPKEMIPTLERLIKKAKECDCGVSFIINNAIYTHDIIETKEYGKQERFGVFSQKPEIWASEHDWETRGYNVPNKVSIDFFLNAGVK